MKSALLAIACFACDGDPDASIDRVLEHPRGELNLVKLRIANGEDPFTACFAARGTMTRIPASAGAEGRALVDEIKRVCEYEVPLAQLEQFVVKAAAERAKYPDDPIVPGCGSADLSLSLLLEHHAGDAKVQKLRARYDEFCSRNSK